MELEFWKGFGAGYGFSDFSGDGKEMIFSDGEADCFGHGDCTG